MPLDAARRVLVFNARNVMPFSVRGRTLFYVRCHNFYADKIFMRDSIARFKSSATLKKKEQYTDLFHFVFNFYTFNCRSLLRLCKNLNYSEFSKEFIITTNISHCYLRTIQDPALGRYGGGGSSDR